MIDMSSLAGPLVNGILWGGLFALIGMGLSLVFGVMNLINVAHGDLVILATYFAFFLSTGLVLRQDLPLAMDPILSLVIVMPVMFGLGFAIQKLLLNRALTVSAEAPLIIAFGISLIIQNVALKLWSPMSRSLTPPYALDVFVIGPLRIRLVYVIAFVAALIMVFLLREFLRRTYLGRAISATAQHKKGVCRSRHMPGSDFFIYATKGNTIPHYRLWRGHNRRSGQYSGDIAGRHNHGAGYDFRRLFPRS
jgi:branched-chain amino acid transport system permease protein